MKISYITSHGTAEWVNFDSSDGEVIRLVLDKDTSGAVSVGPRSFIISRGEAKIPTHALADGKYTPIFETDGGVFVGECFLKSGRTVIPRRADEEFIRRLLIRCDRLEKAQDSLQNQVSRLEEKCVGHGIFNFESERKEI